MNDKYPINEKRILTGQPGEKALMLFFEKTNWIKRAEDHRKILDCQKSGHDFLSVDHENTIKLWEAKTITSGYKNLCAQIRKIDLENLNIYKGWLENSDADYLSVYNEENQRLLIYNFQSCVYWVNMYRQIFQERIFRDATHKDLLSICLLIPEEKIKHLALINEKMVLDKEILEYKKMGEWNGFK